MNREACSLLAETIGIILGEFTDEIEYRDQIYKEAEYIAKKSWFRSTVVGHIALKYGVRVRHSVSRRARGKSVRKRHPELDENGFVSSHSHFILK